MKRGIIQEYILQKKLEGLKASTLANYTYRLNSSVLPCLTDGIETEEKVIFQQIELLQERLATKTYTDFIVLFNDFLKFLYLKKYRKELLQLPCPKQKKNTIIIFNEKEQQMLENYLMSNMNSFSFGILLALYTGIRIGELSALKHSDIESNGILHITKTLQRIRQLDDDEKKTRILIDDPKTLCSIRQIPLQNFILKLYKQFLNKKPANYLLTCSKKYLEPRNIERRFQTILKHVGIEQRKFHTLRHTFATNSVRSGFEIKSLSEILGHSSVKITLESYVHSDILEKKKNMEKLTCTQKRS